MQRESLYVREQHLVHGISPPCDTEGLPPSVAFGMGEDAEGGPAHGGCRVRICDLWLDGVSAGGALLPYWIGYVHRYWCLATGLSGKRACETCGTREMRGLYLAYHALDPAQYEHAVERGLELGYVAMDGRSGALN